MMLSPMRLPRLRIRGPILSALFLGSALALGSCVTVDESGDSTDSSMQPELREPPKPRPWTATFRAPALLIANNVYIEGPQGLLDHVATRSVDEFHSYVAETLPEGFRQSYRVLRPEVAVELRSYLDALEIVAFNELVVIEKPGELDVTVRATGDAFWRDTTSGNEKRSFEITLHGPVDRAPSEPPK